MIIIIYFTEDKKNYQIIRPQAEGPNKFRGDASGLVEYITKSDRDSGRRNYHSFEIL